MKKYAFILMGNYNTDKDKVKFGSKDMITYIYTVKNFEQAKELVKTLKNEKIGAVETCGAFSKENIEQLSEILGEQAGIARVIATPEERELLSNFFND